MHRKILIILALTIILIAAGCKTKGNGSDIILEVHTGTDGLVMDFLENAPPEEVYEDGIVPVYVQMENKGAFDINDGYLALGYEKSYMSVHSWQTEEPVTNQLSEDLVQFSLKGKSSSNIDGDNKIVNLKLTAGRIEEQSERHESAILITSCYKYETEVEETACVDTDIYNLKKRDKTCEAKDLSLSSQGAPVAVDEIEVKMLPHMDENKIKPQFIIHAKNEGDGEVIREGSVEKACSSAPLSFDDYNRIAVKAFLSDKQLDCDLAGESNAGEMRLTEREGYIVCGLEEGIGEEKGTYSTPLVVLLDYGYTHSISSSVTIKKILTH